MVSGRLGNNAYDFCVMGDNEYPDYKIDAPWQTPASMFDETWGYRSWQKRESAQAKTDEKLLSLIKVVSRGGNYLLNIGPKGDGTVVPYEAEVLKAMGLWLQKHNEAIYETSGNPFPDSFPWGEVTTKDGHLYLILSGKPTNTIVLPGISGNLKNAVLMDNQKSIFKTKKEKDNLVIPVSEGMFQKHSIQVIKIEFQGNYLIKPVVLPAVKELTLNFQNAIKHYSYSCIDYYNNHRSVVKESWNFSKNQKNTVPEIYFTEEEKGKEIEIIWNGKFEVIKLEGGGKVTLNEKPVSCTWGNRYFYTPFQSDFEGTPGSITSVIDPNSAWGKNKDRKWNLISAWKNGIIVSQDSKPMQSLFILQEITTDQDQNQLIDLMSGSGVMVWLNGENLVKHNNPRGSNLNKEIVLLPLKAGKNQLLIKFYNRYDYQTSYGIDNSIPQTVYRQKLAIRNFNGINNCELRLYKPESEHQPIRMNNVRIVL
jgi:alpha-L-fucosidase